MRSVGFRVDGSPSIGLGHAYRCASLALALTERKVTVRFFSATAQWVERFGFPVTALDGMAAEPMLEALRAFPVDGLVIDHYGIDQAWQEQVRPSVSRVLVIDDLPSRPHSCDLLLDQNLRDPAEYRALTSATLLCGPRYALLRSEFARLRGEVRDGEVRRVLVSFGGSDPDNQTERAVAALLPLGLPIDVIAGSANAHVARLRAQAEASPQIRLFVDIDNMAERLAGSDLVIGAPGTSTWERCCLGLPSICLAIADNQIDVGRAGHDAGVLWYAGEARLLDDSQLRAVIESVVSNRDLLRSMSQRGMELVDGKGAGRVARALIGERLTLRRATHADLMLYFEWANDPSVREVGFHRDPIPLEQHRAWFEKRVADPRTVLYVGESQGKPVGQVRYEARDGFWEVGIAIDRAFRGQGIGPSLLSQSAERLFADSDASAIHAVVRQSNQSSRRAFLAAGYKKIADRAVDGIACEVFLLTKEDLS